MLCKHQAQEFGESLHGARLVMGDGKARVMISGRTLQEQDEVPGSGGDCLARVLPSCDPQTTIILRTRKRVALSPPPRQEARHENALLIR